MAAASTPVSDTHAAVHNSNSVTSPSDALFTFFTLPCPVESDLDSLYPYDCTQAQQVGDTCAAAQWIPMAHSPAIASPRGVRASSRHCHQDCCSAAGSCHRCKRRPVLGALLACISPHCSLKFCTTCLSRNHAFRAETVMPCGRIHCPRCLEICTCKACIRRNKGPLGRSASPQQQLPRSGTAGSVLSLGPHSTISRITENPQVVIPLEVYELLVQTAKQHVGLQAPPLV